MADARVERCGAVVMVGGGDFFGHTRSSLFGSMVGFDVMSLGMVNSR